MNMWFISQNWNDNWNVPNQSKPSRTASKYQNKQQKFSNNKKKKERELKKSPAEVT